MALLSCEKDFDEWKAENRLPMFPGKVQRWVVATRRGPVEGTLTEKRIEFIGNDVFRWLATQGPAFGLASAKTEQAALKKLPVNIKRFNVLRVSDNPLEAGFGGKPLHGFGPLTFKPPIIKSDTKFVAIEFLYTGEKSSVPWPFGDPNPILFCPEDADIIPVGVWKAIPVSQAVPPPPRKTPFEDLFPDLNPGDLPNPKTVLNVALWGSAAIILWQVFATSQDMSRRFRRS